ncbi:hypothetical protein HYT57_01485 [Candidatus Woesearchaeota archaeon]|nr:hypothetical protein [Candidatus Woesearchaeota archaeon]
MGRSKLLFEREYSPTGMDHNLPDDPIFKDADYFLNKAASVAKLMLQKQESINQRLVKYWIWGMEEGVAVYKLESSDGEQVLSIAKVTIRSNTDESLPVLEARVTLMLPRV